MGRGASQPSAGWLSDVGERSRGDQQCYMGPTDTAAAVAMVLGAPGPMARLVRSSDRYPTPKWIYGSVRCAGRSAARILKLELSSGCMIRTVYRARLLEGSAQRPAAAQPNHLQNSERTWSQDKRRRRAAQELMMQYNERRCWQLSGSPVGSWARARDPELWRPWTRWCRAKTHARHLPTRTMYLVNR